MDKDKLIKWLLEGDESIVYLTQKYLLDESVVQNDKGFIQRYFDLFNTETDEWGGGIYAPLWISSHYTLLELKYMEASYYHPCYQKAAVKLLNGLWFNQGKVSARRYQDMCMSAMLLSILCYGRFKDERMNEIVDYILSHQMEDGGWNCAWDSSTRKSFRGSFHTTICVLEAFADYQRYGCSYRLKDICRQVRLGQEYLLKRRLLYSLQSTYYADEEFSKSHYPVRYKYDCFRALEYFTNIGYPHDSRMDEALSILKAQLSQAPLPVGKRYSGKIHFRLETSSASRFNTFRALKIMKYFNEKSCI